MKLSLFQQHRQRWDGCTKCDLHLTRSKIVYYRGRIPCEILFVGEAPWTAEDASGLPFDGAAGDLLNSIVAAAVPSDLRCAFTNVVCCKPPRKEDGSPGKPTQKDILACRPRLVEFIEIAKAQLLVCVGDISHKHLPTLTEGAERVSIVHPAAILRADAIQKQSMVNRAVVVLANAVQGVFHASATTISP